MAELTISIDFSYRQLAAAGFIAAYRLFRDAVGHAVRSTLADLWRAVQDARRAYVEACA